MTKTMLRKEWNTLNQSYIPSAVKIAAFPPVFCLDVILAAVLKWKSTSVINNVTLYKQGYFRVKNIILENIAPKGENAL